MVERKTMMMVYAWLLRSLTYWASKRKNSQSHSEIPANSSSLSRQFDARTLDATSLWNGAAANNHSRNMMYTPSATVEMCQSVNHKKITVQNFISNNSWDRTLVVCAREALDKWTTGVIISTTFTVIKR